MRVLRVPILSRPYVYLPLALENAGVPLADPTLVVVDAAFPAAGVLPVSGDWTSTVWEHLPDHTWRIAVLVGPGAPISPTGSTDMHVRIHQDPQLIEECVGRVVFG